MPLAKKEIPRALAVLEWDKTPGFLHVSSCANPEECESLPRYFSELIDDHIYSIATSLPKNKLIAFLERGLLKPEQVPADIMAELGDLKLPTNETVEPVITIDKEAIRADLDGLNTHCTSSTTKPSSRQYRCSMVTIPTNMRCFSILFMLSVKLAPSQNISNF